jgi:hypothetical protein
MLLIRRAQLFAEIDVRVGAHFEALAFSRSPITLTSATDRMPLLWPAMAAQSAPVSARAS